MPIAPTAFISAGAETEGQLRLWRFPRQSDRRRTRRQPRRRFAPRWRSQRELHWRPRPRPVHFRERRRGHPGFGGHNRRQPRCERGHFEHRRAAPGSRSRSSQGAEPETVIGGPEVGEAVLVSGNVEGVVVRNGAHDTSILNVEVTGHANAGIRVVDAPDNGIGGAGGPAALPILPGPDGGISPVTWGNQIHGNKTGIEIVGAKSRNNAVRGNTTTEAESVSRWRTRQARDSTTMRFSPWACNPRASTETEIRQNLIADNAGPGLRLLAGTTLAEAIHNRIQGNAVGVEIRGAASWRNRVSENVISGNAALGIALFNGGRQGIEPPRIETWSSQTVSGRSGAPDGSRVEVYADPTPEFDEGLRFLGAGRTVQGRFHPLLRSPLRPDEVGRLFGLNATVTDPEGNTSEFGGTAGEGRAFRLAFTSTRDGNPELYLAQGLLSEPLRLTRDPASIHWHFRRKGNPTCLRFDARGKWGDLRHNPSPARIRSSD